MNDEPFSASAAAWPVMPDPADLERLAGGESADVFLLPADRVLTLLRPGLPAALAVREFAAAQIAHQAGLPVPAPHFLASAGGRYGLVSDRVGEPRLLRRVRRLPGPVMATLAALARRQAALHRLTAPTGTLPAAHDLLAARIDESLAAAAIVARAQAALSALPQGDRLLHGDLHLGNIVTGRTGAMLIDWSQAMTGDPAADVARTDLLMRFGRYGPILRRYRWMRAARHAAAAWYLVCYRAMTGMPAADIDAWRLPLAVAWLREGSAAHAPSLRAYLERRWGADQSR